MQKMKKHVKIFMIAVIVEISQKMGVDVDIALAVMHVMNV